MARIDGTLEWLVDEDTNRVVGQKLPDGTEVGVVTSQTDPVTGGSVFSAGGESVISIGSRQQCDVVVYGATPAGICAAISAKRGGANVLLVSPNSRVGGLMTGGLSRTDYRGFQPRMGWNLISQEIMRRQASHYGMTLSEFGLVVTSPYSAEPHVTEMVFRDMLAEYEIPVIYGWRVESADRQAGRIAGIVLSRGAEMKRVTARVYIDAGYEADLLMRSGATWRYGREANNEYSETTNGVRALTGIGTNLSPYVIPGDPASGLLPRFTAEETPAAGSADNGVQAYGHRLIVTNVPSNRIPFPEPEVYNPLEYEILGRRIGQNPGNFQTLDKVFLVAPLPNGKFDLNNTGLSLDYTGGNVGFVTGSYDERAVITQNHINYTLGYLKFLREDSRIPESLKNAVLELGFCADEFRETGGMSPELYIRESARMVGEYVLTQSEITRANPADDWVSLATYSLDSHGVSLRVDNGIAKMEGSLTGDRTPLSYYGISYRAMLPKLRECANLLVCGNGLSATHVAFCGVRLEHNLMGLGEAAGAAAALSVTTGRGIHEITGREIQRNVSEAIYHKDQILVASAPSVNGEVVVTGGWAVVTNKGPTFVGSAIYSDGNSQKGQKKLRFIPGFGSPGRYLIRLNAPADGSGMGRFKITVSHRDGVDTWYMDHKTGEGFWKAIGAWNFDDGDFIEVENSGDPDVTGSASGFLLVDAVGWTPIQ